MIPEVHSWECGQRRQLLWPGGAKEGFLEELRPELKLEDRMVLHHEEGRGRGHFRHRIPGGVKIRRQEEACVLPLV